MFPGCEKPSRHMGQNEMFFPELKLTPGGKSCNRRLPPRPRWRGTLAVKKGEVSVRAWVGWRFREGGGACILNDVGVVVTWSWMVSGSSTGMVVVIRV